MYQGYNVMAVTPAGKRRYMKLLASYILPSQILDRWDIWVNTTNQRGIDFFKF